MEIRKALDDLFYIFILNKYIFDPIRKKTVVMTPEEEVRQNLIRYLTSERGYPQMLISVEAPLKFAGAAKRTDVVVYNNKAQPLMLIECKAPDVAITNKVFEQIAVYNIPIKAPYLLVTNGIQSYCMRVDTKTFLKDIPEYDEMKTV